MTDEIGACSRELRRLGDAYYHQQLGREEYRAQRKQLLDRLEAEMRRGTEGREAARGIATEPSATST